VQLAPGSDADGESRLAAGNGAGSVSHVYQHAFPGFAGEFTPQAIAALQRNPWVALIEADGVATAADAGTQATPVWGLDRIDDRTGLDQSYEWPASGDGVSSRYAPVARSWT